MAIREEGEDNMLDIFEILGPVMVGPSSSHTAGAVRIGRMARTLLGGEPVRARIGLYGSFAETSQGHGTDKALVAGLLGLKPDDMKIPNSFDPSRLQSSLCCAIGPCCLSILNAAVCTRLSQTAQLFLSLTLPPRNHIFVL